MKGHNRTASLEIRSVNERPPPPPSGSTIREWFAGLALMNPTLMSGVDPKDRANEAVRLADELVAALTAPRIPDLESIKPSIRTEETKERKGAPTDDARSRPTIPEFRPRRRTTRSMQRPNDVDASSRKKRRVEDTRYMFKCETVETVDTRIPTKMPR